MGGRETERNKREIDRQTEIEKEIVFKREGRLEGGERYEELQRKRGGRYGKKGSKREEREKGKEI